MINRWMFTLTACFLLMNVVFVSGNVAFAQDVELQKEEDVIEEPVEEEKEPEVPKEVVMPVKFELEVECADGTEREWEYIKKKKKVKAEIEYGDKEIKGPEAIEKMEGYLSQLQLKDKTDDEAIIEHVLDIFDVNRADVKKLELEIKCESGRKIKIKQ
ncbi:MAG: YusW family protein [Bacillus sp. (in: Bacteria)]|nr:YusW family protein [Bacillus sp. (in: firmicutes)]